MLSWHAQAETYSITTTLWVEPGELPAVAVDAEPDEAGDGDDERAQGGGGQVGQGPADEDGGPPHGQGPEAVDDAGVEVGAQADRGAHGRGGEVQREQAGDGEVGIAAAAGQDDPGAEHAKNTSSSEG